MDCKLICIIGPDGTGKSTQAFRLLDTLRQRGIDCEYKWLRFNHLFSLPVLAVGRILGLSEVSTLKDGKKIGYHYYSRSKIVSSVYSITMFFDTILNYIVRVHLPIKLLNKTIVCDRFIYDTIIDVMIATGRSDFDHSMFSKRLAGIVPNHCTAILLMADEGVLRQRRDDVMQDKTLESRIKLYDKLGSKYGLLKIDAGLPIPEISNRIEGVIFR